MPLWVTLQLKRTPTFGAQLSEIRASHRFRPSLLTSRGHPRNAMWQQCFSKQAAIPGTLVPKRQRVCLQRSPAPRPCQHPPPPFSDQFLPSPTLQPCGQWDRPQCPVSRNDPCPRPGQSEGPTGLRIGTRMRKYSDLSSESQSQDPHERYFS